jgi:nicotinate dehydrogenase subunit B
MTPPGGLRTRRDFLDARGVLLVLRDVPPIPAPPRGQPPAVPADPAEGVEVLLAIRDDGRVIALHGHVDLGTGLRTALAQIVADELDVSMAQVEMVMGDTARAPNQGATIASASIQIHAAPLRLAAAQARAWLVEHAAAKLGVTIETVVVRDGVVHASDARTITFGDLLTDQHVELHLDPLARVKAVDDYRVVGQSMPRVDIPDKATGALVFVHDMRVDGMLHGRVVRPPYAGADHGDFIGNTLESVDESSIAHIPGIRAIVVIRDFVGVVAEGEEHAEEAAATLRVTWKPWPTLPSTDDIAAALSANPSTSRRLVDEGDVDAALANAAHDMPRTYLWPYQMHASIGPSCAVADWHGDAAEPHALTVWAGTQNPHVLRADLAKLAGVEAMQVEVIRMEAAGCYGRNGADDVAADAALLSRAVGAPVRVQLTREQEHLWEPKGAAQWMTVRGGLAHDGSVAAYDFATSYPSNGAPTLALLLTRAIDPAPHAFEMGDRTARPPYDYRNLRVTVNDMAPILRASWLRGVSALPNSFAHESYVDELATAAGVDPVAFRLKRLSDPRARELLEATAAKAGWVVHSKPQQQGATDDVLHGQGVAYARYMHSVWPGYGAAWSAWVADVDVNRVTGEVHVRRVVVGQDAGLMINPAGVRHQTHGNVIQTTSRALMEEVRTDAATNVVATREWGSYPILSFRDVPVIEVVTMSRPDQPPLGSGESSSVPGTAAIANAIFDATGVRFRAPPFTPEVVRAALNPLPDATREASFSSATVAKASRFDRPTDSPTLARWSRRVGLITIGVVGAIVASLGIRSSIEPIARIAPETYSAATIERGRQLAAIGDCVGCHTVPGGLANAGGLPIETPFGTVYGTNLTPDVETGIGAWSFAAFQRAMREGIARDGRHLYPAFPYTSFTRMSDDDLTALYAYLMTQPAVRNVVPATQLAFPFNLRPLMAAWNGLFLTPGVVHDDPARSATWNRGRSLVDGPGHCGACHTERNALGAERETAYLSGAMIKGWEAPALNGLGHAPVPWTEAAFYDYLRRGHSVDHGAALGPMEPVVRELQAAPDDDLRAMAYYLASLNTVPVIVGPAIVVAQARAAASLPDVNQRFFESACGACHHDGDGPRLIGVNVPLALSSKLASDRPDNLLRTIFEGVRAPATREIGFMPSFKDALDDRQVAELAGWMRRRYAPAKAPWPDLERDVARIRAHPTAP